MGKIKRPSAADSFACRTRSGLLAITFLSVRFRARGERAYPPPNGSFSLSASLFPSFNQGRWMYAGICENESRENRAPAERLRPGHPGNSLCVIFVGGQVDTMARINI